VENVNEPFLDHARWRTDMAEKKVITETLQALKTETTGSEVSVEEIAEALNNRGFGSTLMVPALIAFLPTGAIPGVPALCAAMIGLVSVQIIAGRHYPWIPKSLRKLTLKRRKLVSAISTATPHTRVIDRILKPRLVFCTHPVAQKIAGAMCLVLAGVMLAVGFIPFVPAALALPVMFFALGMAAKDGLMTIAGFILSLGAMALVFWLTNAS
jgi:hypothetical protein